MSKFIDILIPDFIYEDERGFLCQLIHDGYKQVNVVYSKAGQRRGGHYHKNNNEAFYVIEGCFNVYLTDGQSSENISFKKGDMFVIKKGIKHDFEYLQNTVIVGLYDIGIENSDGTKDIIAG